MRSDEPGVLLRPLRVRLAEEDPRRAGKGRYELGAVVDEGKPNIDVVEEHVDGRQIPGVLDLVVQEVAGLAQAGRVAPGQHQILAVGLRLDDASNGFNTQSSPSQRSPKLRSSAGISAMRSWTP